MKNAVNGTLVSWKQIPEQGVRLKAEGLSLQSVVGSGLVDVDGKDWT